MAGLGADWLWETDAAHCCNWISEGFERLSGIRSAWVVGRWRIDRTLRAARTTCPSRDHLARLEAREPFHDFVHQLRQTGPECRWVSISGMPVFDDDGAFRGYRGIGRNISAPLAGLSEMDAMRHRLTVLEARARLESDEAAGHGHLGRMMNALDVVSDAFAYYDAKDRLVLFNRALADMYSGLGEAIRHGARFEELIDAGLARGIWVTDDSGEEGFRAEILGRRASRMPSQTILQFSDGRWVMHREMPTEDGGTIGICTDITAMKRHEAELEVARHRAEHLLSDLKRTLDTLDMGVVLLDSRLEALIINKAFYSIWRLRPGDVVVGDNFRALMDINRHNGIYDVGDAEWEDYVTRRMDEIRQGDVAPREFVRADGCTMIYSVTSLSGGKRLVTYFDVTAMKEREAQLAEALEKAKLAEAVVESVPNPMFVKDSQLRFVLANAAFSRFFGVGPSEMIGRRAIDFVPAGQAVEFEASETSVLETGSDFEIEEDYEFEGEARTRMVRKNHVRTPSGKNYVACSIFDVTELKRQRMAAETSRNNLAHVLDTLPAGVIIYDRDNRFVLANSKVQEALPAMVSAMVPGKPLREAVEVAHASGYFRESGDALLDAIYDTDREAWIDGYLRRYEVPFSAFERRNPDGRWFQAFDTRQPDGTYVGVRVDITELKQRESELRDAQQKAVLADRAKSEFLANMSHEIRTPMNGVMGMAELLARSELDQKQRTFVDIIMKSGAALLTIINDILDFSKIDAGQMVLDPAPFDLAEAIEDVATLISARAKEKDLELIVRIAPGLDERYVGDVGRLRQIVTNLMGNAVKFTDRGHVLVEVTGEHHDDRTRLTMKVVDTGIGIPADKLDLVFDKFSQVDASSTRRHEGTGLGLAITSRLVAMMDGTIGVESEEGKGSTFWFEVELPRAGAGTKDRTLPIDVSGARIVVVDDNAVNRAILMEQMNGWGFDACACESGAEGIAVLGAAARLGLSVDCVVLDFQMPGMTGVDTARAVRATPAIADTPIVMLTSVDQSLTRSSHRSLRIEAQLIKPARSSLLLETIVAAIQRHRGASAGQEEEGRSPAVAPVAETPAPARPLETVWRREDAKRGHRVDILVAEDNEVNQLVFTQILGETSHTFEIVGNGRRAVEAHAAMNPRLILMDVSMPEMNGLEATVAIREREAATGGHVPIVGVTAHALKGDRERCLESGMDDYLSKPISPRALLDMIARWAEGGDLSHGREAG